MLSRCFAHAVFTGSQAKLFSFPFLIPRTPKQLSNRLHAAKNTFPLQTTVSAAAVLRPDPLLGAPPPASCQKCPQENARETEAEDAFFFTKFCSLLKLNRDLCETPAHPTWGGPLISPPCGGPGA